MSFPCVICYNDVRPRQHALECDSCLRWQHRTCGSGVTVLEYRNWTGDQEYICSVCRDAEPEPTEGSFDIEVRHIYECIYENISYRVNLIFEWFTVYATLNNISFILENHQPSN
jgi:hypothetical protein